ncbi:other 1 protein kinase [Favolaschia claudopus]|uniref:Other 1 protein kinase n=1 Tax=Favolaschia claudopus TaxID=2862362 RepID=A0AAW0BRM5_9AGAR
MCSGYDLELADGWILALGEMISSRQGRKVVIHARITSCPFPELNGQTVVGKWSWVSPSRTFEADIIASARRLAEEDYPKMLLHLPEIYCSQRCDGLLLPCKCKEILHEHSEDRILRVMIQKELISIRKLGNPDMLAQAFKAIFECYRWLYEKAHIMHRDISVANLMFHEVHGKMYGVLNDFDRALDFSKKFEFTFKQRTGTKLYIATDLLVPDPPEHLYRHDLESLLYVLVSLTCQITENSPLNFWTTDTMENLRTKKKMAIYEGPFPLCKNGFTGFDLWILDMRDVFRQGFHARNNHASNVERAQIKKTKPPVFDHETLGGEVTFDRFAAAMDPFKQMEGEDGL